MISLGLNFNGVIGFLFLTFQLLLFSYSNKCSHFDFSYYYFEQSFQQKSLWMPRDGTCLTNGEMGYDNSSISEAKRGHQWFMDAAAPELFSNKKQAIESVSSRPVSGIADINVSPWHNAPNIQSVSGQFSDRLFGSEPIRTVNLVDRNSSFVDSGNMNMRRKDFGDQYGSSSSVGLSYLTVLKIPLRVSVLAE